MATRIPLRLYFSDVHSDNATMAGEAEQWAIAGGYRQAATLGYLLSEPQAGTIPLKLYYSDLHSDNATMAGHTEQWAIDGGYREAATLGHIFVDERPGTIPLKLYYSHVKSDNATMAGVAETWAQGAGYALAATLGYIYPDTDAPTDLAVRIERTNGPSSTIPGGLAERLENGRYCTSRKVDLSESTFEKIITASIEDSIYPGAFFEVNSVADGSFKPFNTARAPMELTTNLAAANGNLRATVGRKSPAAINAGTVNEAVQSLMRQNGSTPTTARLVYSAQHIQSEEQLRVFAQADFSGWGASVNAEFGYNKHEKKDFVLVRFTQIYFTVNVNTTDASTLLANPRLAIEGDPVYVSSVSYGRVGYLRIDSDESAETVTAVLGARYGLFGVSGSARAGVDRNRISKNTTFKLFVFGGRADHAVQAIGGGLEEFDNLVRAGAQMDASMAPVPISYRLKFIKDSRNAYTSVTTSFTEQSCRKARYLKVKLCGIAADIRQSPVWGTVDLEMWELDNLGNKVKQVFPARVGSTSRIWDRPIGNRLPVGPYPRQNQSVALDNIQTEWEFWVNPNKLSNDQVVVAYTCMLGSEWQDNVFAVVGYTGMMAPERRERRLQDFLDSGENFLIAGPYRGPSDRPQDFRVQFQISPGR